MILKLYNILKYYLIALENLAKSYFAMVCLDLGDTGKRNMEYFQWNPAVTISNENYPSLQTSDALAKRKTSPTIRIYIHHCEGFD